MVWTRTTKLSCRSDRSPIPLQNNRQPPPSRIYLSSRADACTSDGKTHIAPTVQTHSFSIEYDFSLLVKREMRLFAGSGSNRHLLANLVQKRRGSGNSIITLANLDSVDHMEFHLKRCNALSAIQYTLDFDEGDISVPVQTLEWQTLSYDEIWAQKGIGQGWKSRITAKRTHGTESLVMDELPAIYYNESVSQEGWLYLFDDKQQEYVAEIWLRLHLISAMWVRESF